MVEEGNHLCALFSLFRRVSFTMLITGSNSQELRALRLPIKALDFSPREITIFQFYSNYKGWRRKKENEMKSGLTEILEIYSSKAVFISRCTKFSVSTSMRTERSRYSCEGPIQGILPAGWTSLFLARH